MRIGPYLLDNNLFLAPMAGVTDLPFRRLCKQHGAGVVVSEMVTSDPSLQNSRKTRLRLAHDFESNDSQLSEDEQPTAEQRNTDPSYQSGTGLRVVQIAGGDAEILAQAAISNAERGAQVIDINMGCPAKKVCKKAAGSALLKDPKLVEQILKSVVSAVDIPVTLKIRTGWDTDNKNALQIAQLAEEHGIQSLAIHGRTRACKYMGIAEHHTTALVKQAVSIPVIANGDIHSPETAKQVLEKTGADGLMIGRAAQGRPWIFKEISYYLENGTHMPPVTAGEIRGILIEHVKSLHQFYGELQGVRIARKHTSWYLSSDDLFGSTTTKAFKKKFNYLLSADEQIDSLTDFFDR
jgi:tRNA-dihydrouridine synthase B